MDVIWPLLLLFWKAPLIKIVLKRYIERTWSTMCVEWHHGKTLNHPKSMNLSTGIFQVNNVDVIQWLLSVCLKQFISCLLRTPGGLGCPCEHHRPHWTKHILCFFKNTSLEIWDVQGEGSYSIICFQPFIWLWSSSAHLFLTDTAMGITWKEWLFKLVYCYI